MFSNRLIQFGVFIVWFLLAALIYGFIGELSSHEAFRHSIDVGFNVGIGKFPEKNDFVKMFTIINMFVGHFLVTFFWIHFVRYLAGKGETNIPGKFEHYFPKFVMTGWFILGCLIVWLAIGIGVGGYYNKADNSDFNLLDATNYIVGLITGTGTLKPLQNSNWYFNNVFAAIYIMVGIPLLSIAMATFINYMDPCKNEVCPQKQPDLSLTVETKKQTEEQIPLMRF